MQWWICAAMRTDRTAPTCMLNKMTRYDKNNSDSLQFIGPTTVWLDDPCSMTLPAAPVQPIYPWLLQFQSPTICIHLEEERVAEHPKGPKGVCLRYESIDLFVADWLPLVIAQPWFQDFAGRWDPSSSDKKPMALAHWPFKHAGWANSSYAWSKNMANVWGFEDVVLEPQPALKTVYVLQISIFLTHKIY